MGILTQYNSDIGGIDDSLLSLISKIGNTPLTTTSQDLSSAINELNTNKVNISGDTMTGSLQITNNGELSVSNTILARSMEVQDGDIILGYDTPYNWGTNNEFSHSLNDTLSSINNSLTTLIKLTEIEVTSDSSGDITLFSTEKKILSIKKKSGTGTNYVMFIPYLYNGGTKAKCLSFATTTYNVVTSQSWTLEVTYID